MYETGGMRRPHLRGHENILKRLIVHAAGVNLGLLLRQVIGIGKPRRLQDFPGLLLALILRFWGLLRHRVSGLRCFSAPWGAFQRAPWRPSRVTAQFSEKGPNSTGC